MRTVAAGEAAGGAAAVSPLLGLSRAAAPVLASLLSAVGGVVSPAVRFTRSLAMAAHPGRAAGTVARH